MKIDEALAQIAKLETSADGPPAVMMDLRNFEAYVELQVSKSVEEITGGKVDLGKERLTALKSTIATHKASFEVAGGTATVQPFKDPWQALPTSKEANPQEVPTTTSGIAIPGDLVTTEKAAAGFGFAFKATDKLQALIMVSKASAASPLHAKLGKTDQGKALIAKAGEATAILAKIASMFGLTYESSSDLLDCELRWDVGDMITALQSAAKLESVMTTLGGTMAVKQADPPAAAATPPPAAPATPAPTQKSAGEAPATPDAFDAPEREDDSDDGDWPIDLSKSLNRDQLQKDAEALFAVKKPAPAATAS